jgi:methylmalonyl-CoA carboxyltransferase large subunit
MSKNEIKRLAEQVAELGARIEKLEGLVAALAKAPVTAPAELPRSNEAAKQEIPAEIIVAISAAVAAFLGKRASIRQIRLTGTTPWAQQGRATVQASHAVEFVRGLR